MNRRYESIYTSFIEGRFEQALSDKKMADSIYGNHYWTPQLLYIQSVYHIKQHQDDQAKVVLQQIIKLYPTSPLSPRAQTMLDVLGRRKEIEDYLTNLKIERPGEDSSYIVNDAPAKALVTVPPVIAADNLSARQADSLLALQKLEDDLKAKQGGAKPIAGTDTARTSFKVAATTMLDTFSRKVPGIVPDTAVVARDSALAKTDVRAPMQAHKDPPAVVPPVPVTRDSNDAAYANFDLPKKAEIPFSVSTGLTTAPSARIVYRTIDNWTQQASVAASHYNLYFNETVTPNAGAGVEFWRQCVLDADGTYIYFRPSEAGKTVLLSYRYGTGAPNADTIVENQMLTIDTNIIDPPTGIPAAFTSAEGRASNRRV
ncbi:MAG: hypothetical protein EOP50_18170, partial [Sphingobacteriales bacterium]